MQIKDMFAKQIDRDIKGVIKVGQGDDANVQQELSEYVVTRELQKHFADFFANYKTKNPHAEQINLEYMHLFQLFAHFFFLHL